MHFGVRCTNSNGTSAGARSRARPSIGSETSTSSTLADWAHPPPELDRRGTAAAADIEHVFTLRRMCAIN